jgi:hypothetical protein
MIWLLHVNYRFCDLQKWSRIRLMSCLRNSFDNSSRFYDTLGIWGSLFRFTTVYPEVVERPFDRLTVLSKVEGHHNFAYYEAAPRTMFPQRHSLFLLSRRYCGGPVHRTLSCLGAVTGSGVFWVVELKRDPHVPFESIQQVLIIQRNSETRH